MTIYTLEELGRLVGAPDDASSHQRRLLGLLVPRMVMTGGTDPQPSGWHLEQLLQDMAEGRAEVYFDAYGRPCGSMVCRRLCAETHARVLAGAPPVAVAVADVARMAPAREAGADWVVHFATRHVDARQVLRRALRGPLAGLQEIAYVRTCRGQRMAKQLRLPRLVSAKADAVEAPERHFLRRDAARQLRGEATALLEEAWRLGDWLLLSCSRRPYSLNRLVDVLAALEMPLRRAQYLEVRNQHGDLEALLTYGLLTQQGWQRWHEQGALALSPACFSEGAVLTATCAAAHSSSTAHTRLGTQAAMLHPGLRRSFIGTAVPDMEALSDWPMPVSTEGHA